MKTLLLLLAAQMASAQGIDWVTQLKNRPDILKSGNNVLIGSVNGGNVTIGTTVLDGTLGIKGPIVACVGAPGNTAGPFGSLCEVRASGALWACTNAASCTVAADWAAAGGGGGGSGAGAVLTTVAFSATPTYAVSTSSVQTFKITLTGNVTSSTLSTSLATAGQVLVWEICQDGTGGRTHAWPANVLDFGTIDAAASSCSKQSFLWDGVNAIAASIMVSDAITPALITAAGTLSLPTAPDTLLGRASTDPLTNKTIDTASNTVKLAGTTITGKQGNTGVVQTAGTVSGTGAALCTDANGNTTTSGCPSGGGLTVHGWCTGTIGNGASFGAMVGLGGFTNTGSCLSTPSINGGTLITHACTLQNFYFRSSANGGGVGDGVVKVKLNASDSGLTCTTNATAACNDTTHTAAASAGDIVWVTTATTSGSLANVIASLECK